jgi:prepilin-type N-terminal cleavage/methylation domain-containing protein/prepilin-type processing-associated H-X9-DG protein
VATLAAAIGLMPRLIQQSSPEGTLMVRSQHLRGFTLVELLVVLAIVATLVGLLLTGVQRARSAAQRVQCANNLRQIGLALHQYHDLQRVLPPGVRGVSDSYPFMGWTARLLPYLEQQAIWEQAQADYGRQRMFFGPPPHAGLEMVRAVFNCPAMDRDHGQVEPEGFDVAFTHYLGVIGQHAASRDGMLFLDSKVKFADVTDGTSLTLMVGERPPSPDNRFGWWYAGVGQGFDGDADSVLGVADFRTTFRAPTCPLGPYSFRPGRLNDMCDTFHFWSLHSGGGNFLMVDGSVHFFPYSAAALLPALASRSGGESVTLPE